MQAMRNENKNNSMMSLNFWAALPKRNAYQSDFPALLLRETALSVSTQLANGKRCRTGVTSGSRRTRSARASQSAPAVSANHSPRCVSTAIAAADYGCCMLVAFRYNNSFTNSIKKNRYGILTFL
jgi:hypothetical protein